MGLFDRHAGLLEAYRDVRTTGYDPFQIRMERVLSPTEAIINGRETLLVGTNNYFGLTFDPSCMDAAIEAIRAEGTGTTGSRIANGSYTEHVALEKELAEFYDKKHCMVFTTGYQANLGVISTLVGQGDYLLIDADSHASIYDACKLTQAEVDPLQAQRPVEPRGPPAPPGRQARQPAGRARRHLFDAGRQRAAQGIRRRLQEVRRLHAGRRGPFAGRARRQRPRPVRGGRRAGRLPFHRRHLLQDPGRRRRLLRLGRSRLRHPARHRRAYMFTASLPPSIVASVRQALRVVRAKPELRQQLWDNVATLYDGLKEHGFTLGPEHGPVVGVHLPDRMPAIGFWRALLDAGIYVNVAVPPATPNGVSLLRCSLCAVHTASSSSTWSRS